MRFNKIAPELNRAAEAQARKELGDTYGLIDVGDVATIEQLLELNATIEWAHNMTVLVTGDAGYIGSHMVHASSMPRPGRSAR